MSEGKRFEAEITKFDESRRLVFGWAIICKKGGKPYYDLQGDFIPESTMLDSTTDFMLHSRAAGQMHKSAVDFEFKGEQVGHVVYAFPMTDDIAESLDLTSGQTGLLIGARIDSDEVLAKVRSGEYTGFSIEGKRLSQDILNEVGDVVKTEEFDA